jgi:hypothetical protein
MDIISNRFHEGGMKNSSCGKEKKSNYKRDTNSMNNITGRTTQN